MVAATKKGRVTLGRAYEHTVSGLVGVAITREEMLNGCIAVGIQPRIKKPGAVEMPKAWSLFESELKDVETQTVCDALEPSADAKKRLGKVYQDSVTDFVGTCVGRVEYLNGTIQLVLSSKLDNDGKRQEARGFDEARCTEAKTGKAVESKAERGGHDTPSAHY